MSSETKVDGEGFRLDGARMESKLESMDPGLARRVSRRAWDGPNCESPELHNRALSDHMHITWLHPASSWFLEVFQKNILVSGIQVLILNSREIPRP